MPMKPGNFAWYELMTSDTKAAETFYQKVIGWNCTPLPAGGPPYTSLSVGGHNIGGLMPIPDDMGEHNPGPCWTGYILVDDVDASVGRLKAAGGKLLRGPFDIPDMLRMAVVSDPQGAVFILFKGMSPEAPPELSSDAPGNVGWHELHADDGASAFDFYSEQFGWTKSQALDMGPMGIYQTFTFGSGLSIGGMMTRTADTPHSCWLFYFNVDAIDAAAARTTDGGGRILMGPHQVPTGQWILVCSDPQGAQFAMLAPKR